MTAQLPDKQPKRSVSPRANSFNQFGGDLAALEAARKTEAAERRRQQRTINLDPKRRDQTANRREADLRGGYYG